MSPVTCFVHLDSLGIPPHSLDSTSRNCHRAPSYKGESVQTLKPSCRKTSTRARAKCYRGIEFMIVRYSASTAFSSYSMPVSLLRTKKQCTVPGSKLAIQRMCRGRSNFPHTVSRCFTTYSNLLTFSLALHSFRCVFTILVAAAIRMSMTATTVEGYKCRDRRDCQ